VYIHKTCARVCVCVCVCVYVSGGRKTDPKCIYAYILYIYYFLFLFCEIVSVFDRQYRVIGLGTVSKLPCRIIYLARTNTHTHKQQQTNALQSNSQFSARFIPGMIAGRSRRKIGRYTYNIYVYTHARTHARPSARIAAGQYRIRVYTTRVLSQSNRTLSSASAHPTVQPLTPKSIHDLPLGRR